MKPLQRFSRGSVFALLASAILLAVSTAEAQEDPVQKAVRAFSEKQVKGYIQPIADFMGANMNAGWYHSAAIPEMGFNLSLNFIAMGAAVGDDQKTYIADSPPGFSQPTFQTATVFGGKGTTVTDPSGLSFRGSDGAFDISMFPLATLQLHLGSLYGTEVVIRGLPIPEIKSGKYKVPKTTFFGIGVRHSISQYLVEFPVDIAAGVFWNTIKFGDLIDMKSFAIGAQASKSFSILELYGGLAYEKSSMSLGYTPTNATTGVSLDFDGANKFRATVGVGLNLAILHLYGDVNVGSVTNLSAGLGFGF